jgi:hypothetical protein
VKVVDEPLGGWRDRPFVLDRTGQAAVGRNQDSLVFSDAGPDDVSPARVVGDPLGGRERLRVLLQAIDAEELRDDGLFELALRANPPTNAAGRVSDGLVHLTASCHVTA